MAALSEQERAGAIVYVDERELPAGYPIPISGGGELRLRWPAALAFADLEPTLNWAHRCRYLAVRLDGEDVEGISASLPPFLKGRSPTLRVAWTGERVPEWLRGSQRPT